MCAFALFQGVCRPFGSDSDRTFKFLALGEVENNQIAAMAVDIMPFSQLCTSPSAKNLKAEHKNLQIS
jgi:hypothetical protein